ncbi:MAG TPA: hypothetical protein VL091_05535 [Marinobacter sp.]|nr:hypothetical protein [Marinobacter sp.]
MKNRAYKAKHYKGDVSESTVTLRITSAFSRSKLTGMRPPTRLSVDTFAAF